MSGWLVPLVVVLIGVVPGLVGAADGRWSHFHVGNTPGIRGQDIDTIAVGGERVWFGTAGHGLISFDRRTGQWTTLSPEDGVPARSIHAIIVDGERLWLGTARGVDVQDRRTGVWRRYTVADGLPANDVVALAKRGDEVWAGTGRNGIAIMDVRTRTWRRFAPSPPLPSEAIRQIRVRGDEIWIGTSFGLARFDKQTGRLSTFDVDDGMLVNQVFDIAVAGDEVWCVGHLDRGGVSVYNTTTGRWRTHGVSDGLLDRWATAIALDGEYVWVGNRGGISRLHRPTGQWEVFEEIPGLRMVLGIAVDGQRLWFANGADGIVSYDR